jgi:hypothetical protein
MFQPNTNAECGEFKAPPGTEWGGMKCTQCGIKRSDHAGVPATTTDDADNRRATVPTTAIRSGTAASSSGDPKWMRPTSQSVAPREEKKPTIGTTQGSLGSFMGAALGVKHKGASSGLVREVHDDSAERAYHASKGANRALAQAMGQAMMAALPKRETDSITKPSMIKKT